MKKLLALVLALVMTLGLATVGTNAATELKDTASVGDDYQEAVTVVNAVEVMIGDENGNFNPSNKLTRAEGAAIAARLIATNKVAAELIGNGTKFSDVPANFWNGNGSGMIEYCAVNGILNGVGDNKFDPNGALSAVAFAKMMLTALGYDSQVEGYVNNVDWATHVMTRANRVGILKGLETVKPTDQLTREQAAQIVFNTLKTPIVEYDQKLYTSNGDVLVGSTNAKPVTNEERGKQTIYATRINATSNAAGGYVVEFAEQYYPALVLTADTDDFGRPANNWTYGRDQLGVYGNYDLLVTEWTTAIDGDTVYEAMGALAYKDYAKEVWVDGVELSTKTTPTLKSIVELIVKDGDDLDITGRGVLTQLFVDDANEYARLVVVNTWLAQALTDYNSNTKTISLGVYEAKWDAQVARTAKLTDENEIADLKADDYVLVTMTKPGTTDYTIRSVKAAKANEDAYVSAYTANGTKMTSITVDGEKLNVAAQANWKQEILQDYSLEKLKNFTYDVYFDIYDNIIGINYHTQDTNFVFVVGAEVKSSYLAYTTYTANVIWLDGTMQTITFTLNKTASDATKAALTGTGKGFVPANSGSPVVNAWFTYSKADDGSIIINDMVPTKAAAGTTPYAAYQSAAYVAPIATGSEINSSNTTLDATATGGTYAYGNDKSVYITVDVDSTGTYAGGNGAIKEVTGISTGIKNTSIEVASAADLGALTNFAAAKATLGVGTANTYFLYSSKGYVAAAVVIGEDAGVGRNFVYVISGPDSRQYNSRYLDAYKVIKDGEITTIDVDTQKSGTTPTANKLGAKRLHQVAYDKDGIVIEVKDLTAAGKWTAAGLKVTPNTTINTDTNKKNGYTYNTVTANTNVELDGNTLVIKNEGNNSSYVLIGEGAKFFVWNPATKAFETYTSAKSALEMAKAKDGSKQRLINSITSVVDGTTGFANTVIFYDTYTASTTTAATDLEILDTIPGTYGNAKFYTKDGHEISYDEAFTALWQKMVDEGCTDISINGAENFSYTYNGIKRVANVATLTGYDCTQSYKVTYVDAVTASNSAEAYVEETDLHTAANVEAKLKKVNAANNFDTNDASGTEVVFKTYDGTLVNDTDFNAWKGANTTKYYDITVVYAASKTAALNAALKTVKSAQIVSSVFIPATTSFTDITVPAGTTLTLYADTANLLLQDNGDMTVKGTLTGKVETGYGVTVNAVNSFTADGATLSGKYSVAAPTVTLANEATGDITSVTATTVEIGCELTVETMSVDNIYLVGKGESSNLTVTKTLAPKSAAGVTVDFGKDAAGTTTAAANAKASTLTLPTSGTTDLLAVNVAAGQQPTIVDADDITTLTVADATVALATTGDTDTNVATLAADGTVAVTFASDDATIDTVTTNDGDTAVTIPAGTTNKAGTAATTESGAGSLNGQATAKKQVKVELDSVKSTSFSSPYVTAGDTITLTLKSAAKGTPATTNAMVKSVELTDEKTVTVTMNATVKTGTTISITGLTLKTVTSSEEEVTGQTLTIVLPAGEAPTKNTVSGNTATFAK